MSNGHVEVCGYLGLELRVKGWVGNLSFEKHLLWKLTGTSQWIRLPKESELVSLMAKEKKVQRRTGGGETRDIRGNPGEGGSHIRNKRKQDRTADTKAIERSI